MYNLIRIGVVSLYVMLTGFCALWTLANSGLYISWTGFSIAMAAWALFCGLSVYLLSPFHLFFYGRLRKPISMEEVRLQWCLREVMKKAGTQKNIRIRIVETEADDAFACYADTIAISAPLLDKLTDQELKGILAHELGHLISRDTTLAWAFVTASHLPSMVRWVFFVARAIAWRLAGLTLLVLLLLALFKSLLLLPIIAVLIFLLAFWLLDRIFRWLQLFLSRKCEYRQDAYALSLGYGQGLRDALIKLVRFGKEPVNAYLIFMNGTHPVIYHRIRRLDQLMHQ